MMNRSEDYPIFSKIVDLVGDLNPLQRKSIAEFINGQDHVFWEFAENLCSALNHSFIRCENEWTDVARAYSRMCTEILREQIRFRKTCAYRLKDAQVAREEIYDQPHVMRHYVIGLLMSYLFWPNHYEMFGFFKNHLDELNVEKCLEIGAGHGLFTAEVARKFPKADISVVDISRASIETARDLLRTFQVDKVNVKFTLGDFLETATEKVGFDLVIMGEILEHVDDAPKLAAKAAECLNHGGTLFLSTCVNCPAVDHIYHFHSVDEIRALVKKAGFVIRQELVLPAENVPEERWLDELVTINYCGILER
jgi:SAM-dependent methyltransferase